MKPSDCAVGVCMNGSSVATSTDGMTDGTETDADCGGADDNDVEPLQTQYGQAGFRCARAIE
jgi:hypothetical protein